MDQQLGQALTHVELSPADDAARELAHMYAQAIDAGGPIDTLGPKLLAVLESLGMTPRSRNAVVKGGGEGENASPLDELRQRRNQRQNRAAPMDPATS